MDNKIKQATKAIKDVETKIKSWNERSNFTLKGVKNLSMSDMETIKYYSEVAIKNIGFGYPIFHGIMEPLGSLKEVLEKYNLID